MSDESAILTDYVTVFSTVEGQRVLDDLDRRSFVGKTTMTVVVGHGADPLVMAYNEGRRAQALDIRARYQRGLDLKRSEPPRHAGEAEQKAKPSLTETTRGA